MDQLLTFTDRFEASKYLISDLSVHSQKIIVSYIQKGFVTIPRNSLLVSQIQLLCLINKCSLKSDK